MGGIFIDAYLKGREELCRLELDEAVFYDLISIDILKYNYGIEVIKALVVLKRSQLVKEVKNSKYASYTNQDIVIDETKIHNVEEEKKVLLNAAIEATRGIIAVNGNKAVDMYITNSCGGGTSNSEDVLGYRVNYLRRVLCKYCTQSFEEKNISLSEYIKRYNLKGHQYKGNLDGIFNEVERDETGRIISINFLGVKMTGEEFGEYFGLESNRVYFMEDSVIFKAIGKGMGLGICLEGANNFAQQGAGYKDIINYYYTGITFEKLDEYVLLKTLRDKKIVIDPGHGGGDTGNVTSGLEEKNVNLIIARLLEKKLSDIGADVLLTRNDDRNVPLGDRVEFINRERPGLYISIHQNDFMSPGVNGVECYCYSRDEDALRLGSIITREISSKTGVKNRGVRTGDYFLLRECKLSGVIVECMYMTGNQDREKYTDENYLKIAEAIFKSICEYYNIEPEIDGE